MALFIAALFIGQIAESTDPIFAILTAVFIGLWACAFNVAGGLQYVSGAFIFSAGFTTIVAGFGFKILLGEPAQGNLKAPITTMLVYNLGMSITLAVAAIVRQLRPARSLVKGFNTLGELKRGASICFFCGWGIAFLLSVVHMGQGSVFSALHEFNDFPFVAIILATIYEIRRTGGRRSMNWVVKVSIGLSIMFGIVFFGKEGLMIGFVAWGLAAITEGYDFKRRQLVTLIIAFAFFNYYLVPYSQYVRTFGSESHSFAENLPVALRYLGDLPETRRLYLAQRERADIQSAPHFFDRSEGFADRLVQLPMDDALVDYTEQGHVFGLLPTYAAYANVVPHFLWKDKPAVDTGNLYSRELGLLPEEDITTGIAIGAAADAFHQASWAGLALLLPFDLFVLFVVYDSVLGSANDSPFILYPIMHFVQFGSEGGLDGVVIGATVGLEGVLFVVLVVKVIAPRVIELFAQAPRGEAPRGGANGAIHTV